jgi:hypothetical protein
LPRKQKTFWDSLSKDTRDIIALFGLAVAVIIVAFVLQNPILGLTIIGVLAIAGGTIYWKLKTGQWWFQTSSSHKDDSSILPAKQTTVEERKTHAGPVSFSSDATTSTRTTFAAPTISTPNSHLQSIISKIQQFRPLQRVYDEKQYQDMLFSFMSDTFRSLRREVPFPNKKYIDATIGNVGIELKFQPNESDIDRAYSQVESYLDHLDHVIIVISSPRTPDAMRYLEDKLERRGWLNSRVFIVEQTV